MKEREHRSSALQIPSTAAPPDVDPDEAAVALALAVRQYRVVIVCEEHQHPEHRAFGGRVLEPPSATAQRLYCDTVGHGSEIALWAACKAFRPDHLLAGSDYPITQYFEPYAANFDCIQTSDLTEDDKAGILAGNAAKLLGLEFRLRRRR